MMWDWNGDSWAAWLVMMTGMLAFWVLVVWLIATLVRNDRRPSLTDAEAVLRERFARGDIDAAEYEQRLDVLRRGREPVARP